MSYVDGFLVAVPNANKQAYLDLAATVAKVLKEHGATRVVECWGDDVPEGKVTDFARAVQAEPGETVVFSWVEYPSKQVRDAAVSQWMQDERLKGLSMPFDGKRMIMGGFNPIMDQ
jgi:uncharacterized protein YbaA (DUF1428 family)